MKNCAVRGFATFSEKSPTVVRPLPAKWVMAPRFLIRTPSGSAFSINLKNHSSVAFWIRGVASRMREFRLYRTSATASL